VALCLSRFGELHLAKNDYARSEQFFRQSVQLFSETLGAENVQTGAARIELGGVLLRERRYREAEAERNASLEAAVNARSDLVSLYWVLNMPEKASKIRAEQSAAERLE